MFWFLMGYSIIGSGSGFTVNLGSDSLGKSNDLGVSSVSRIHFGFGFIVNPDPDPIMNSPLVDLFYFILRLAPSPHQWTDFDDQYVI